MVTTLFLPETIVGKEIVRSKCTRITDNKVLVFFAKLSECYHIHIGVDIMALAENGNILPFKSPSTLCRAITIHKHMCTGTITAKRIGIPVSIYVLRWILSNRNNLFEARINSLLPFILILVYYRYGNFDF